MPELIMEKMKIATVPIKRMRDFILKHRWSGILLLSLAVLFLIIPLHTANAAVIAGAILLGAAKALGSALLDVAGELASLFGTIIFIKFLTLFVGEFLLSFGDGLIAFASQNPLGFSMTSPATNPIIEIGWTLLRDFTNMLFILGIAYIGLATSLNIAGFNTKKLLGSLLIIALIINFTPVITGAIVDVSNIIFHFFVEGSSFNNLVLDFQNRVLAHTQSCGGFGSVSNVARGVSGFFSVSCWAEFIILGPYGLIAGFILTMFGLIILVRHVAIWIFVILSPLAFFSWIFRGGGKSNPLGNIWDKWWDQFLKWSFIVIPAGFFIYLARQVLAIAPGQEAARNAAGDPFFIMLPNIVTLLFLGFALISLKKINAIGVSQLTTFGKLAGAGIIAGVGWAGLKLSKGIRNAGRRFRGKRPDDFDSREEYEAWKNEDWKNKVRGTAGEAGRYIFGGETEEERKRWNTGIRGTVRAVGGLASLGTPYWARPAARSIAGRMQEETENKMKNAYKDVQGSSIDRQRALLKNLDNLPGYTKSAERVGTFKAIVNDGNIDDVIKDEEERKRITERIMREALTISPEELKSVRYIDPKIAEKVAKTAKMSDRVREDAGLSFSSSDEEKYGTLENKLIATINPNKMNLWSRSTAIDAVSSRVAQENWGGAHISQGFKEFGDKFADAVQDGIESMGDSWENVMRWFEENNGRLFKYYNNSAAKSLGVGFPDDPDTASPPRSETGPSAGGTGIKGTPWGYVGGSGPSKESSTAESDDKASNKGRFTKGSGPGNKDSTNKKSSKENDSGDSFAGGAGPGGKS